MTKKITFTFEMFFAVFNFVVRTATELSPQFTEEEIKKFYDAFADLVKDSTDEGELIFFFYMFSRSLLSGYDFGPDVVCEAFAEAKKDEKNVELKESNEYLNNFSFLGLIPEVDPRPISEEE